MSIERKEFPPARPSRSRPATIVIGALVLFGTVIMVQWVLASLLGLIKFALFITVVVGVVGWVVSAIAKR